MPYDIIGVENKCESDCSAKAVTTVQIRKGCIINVCMHHYHKIANRFLSPHAT